jgi:tRNA (guanine37-N1)-methyltransferase
MRTIEATVLRCTVVTLFPELVESFRSVGIVRRACAAGIAAVDSVNPRSYADDRRGTVDDAPYGGGPGMVMMVTPLRRAIAAARTRDPRPATVFALSPQGRPFTQGDARRLAADAGHLILVAGRYEGMDERLLMQDVDAEWSIGDFVVSGGELPALLVIEALVRLLPAALGDASSAEIDSFSDGLLDHPHYTRPEVLDGAAVPAVLLSGDHAAIARWRRKQQLGRTWLRRPDLLAGRVLDRADAALLAEFQREHAAAADAAAGCAGPGA